MKFLCDVHISLKLCKFLNEQKYECVHVNNILSSYHTSDEEICLFADDIDLIVVSKDKDFKNSHLLKKSPKKLIKINLGNIRNEKLIEFFKSSLKAIEEIDKNHSQFMIELNSFGFNSLIH